MKRGIIILALLLLLVAPLTIAAEDNTLDTDKETIKDEGSLFSDEEAIETTGDKNVLEEIDLKEFASNNPWNQTVVLSPTWQKIISGLFGLNLHNESSDISVRESIVFFGVFILFFVLIADILKAVPFFKFKLLGGIAGEYVAAFVITAIVSITGAFINLKNLLISGVAYTVAKLNWEWVNSAVESRGVWAFTVGLIIFIGIVILHEIFSWAEPILKKYSEVSRAEAKGRMLRAKIEGED